MKIYKYKEGMQMQILYLLQPIHLDKILIYLTKTIKSNNVLNQILYILKIKKRVTLQLILNFKEIIMMDIL